MIAEATMYGVGVRSGASIFQPALPAVFDGEDRNPDGCSPVGYAVAELVDGLRFVQTGQALIVIGTVHIDVFLDPRLERLADLFEYRLIAARAER